MTPTPVGMRCPECSSQRTQVRSGRAAFEGADNAPATVALIAINVVVYLAQIATGSGGLSGGADGTMVLDYGLFGPLVAEGEWYRLLSYGFLHASLIHIGFNLFALYFLGRLLEPGIGTPRFLGIYFASVLGGAFGALLLDPNVLTVGASGGVFGIFGATFVIARARGIDSLAANIGLIIGLNLVISIAMPRVSLGGHLGGLAAGLLCAVLIVAAERSGLGARRLPVELAAMATLAVVAVAGALAVA